MSGVIDDDGVQWERCNECVEFVRIETLHMLAPGQVVPHRNDAEHGLDLCDTCALLYEADGFKVIAPR